MAYRNRAKRLLAAVGRGETPESASPPASAGPAGGGTEAKVETLAKQQEVMDEIGVMERDIRNGEKMQRDTTEDANKETLRIDIDRRRERLAQKRAEYAELRAQIRREDAEEKKAGGAAESVDLGDDSTTIRRAGFQPVQPFGGVMPQGVRGTDVVKPPEAKKPRFERVDVEELRDYATFLNVLRSRVKLLINLIDEADLEFASDAWKGRKSGAREEYEHNVVLAGVKFGHPYHTVRTWLEQYRLFPDVLSSAFVSVLTSIDRVRAQQRKEPLPLWELVREPHLSTFAKWIGHQHLHDQQLANQWGGRNEGHIALAMSTRDALSYFEQLP